MPWGEEASGDPLRLESPQGVLVFHRIPPRSLSVLFFEQRLNAMLGGQRIGLNLGLGGLTQETL